MRPIEAAWAICNPGSIKKIPETDQLRVHNDANYRITIPAKYTKTKCIYNFYIKDDNNMLDKIAE